MMILIVDCVKKLTVIAGWKYSLLSLRFAYFLQVTEKKGCFSCFVKDIYISSVKINPPQEEKGS